MPSIFYIRLRVVCGAIQSLNDLLELAAFRVNMQLLRVCHLVFPVGYSLGFCLLCCRHCIIGVGPNIRIAIIACVTDCQSRCLVVMKFGDIFFLSGRNCK